MLRANSYKDVQEKKGQIFFKKLNNFQAGCILISF